MQTPLPRATYIHGKHQCSPLTSNLVELLYAIRNLPLSLRSAMSFGVWQYIVSPPKVGFMVPITPVSTEIDWLSRTRWPLPHKAVCFSSGGSSDLPVWRVMDHQLRNGAGRNSPRFQRSSAVRHSQYQRFLGGPPLPVDCLSYHECFWKVESSRAFPA